MEDLRAKLKVLIKDSIAIEMDSHTAFNMHTFKGTMKVLDNKIDSLIEDILLVCKNHTK